MVGAGVFFAFVEGVAGIIRELEGRLIAVWLRVAVHVLASLPGAGVGFGDDGVVAARHCGVVRRGGFALDIGLAGAGLLVEELHQSFVGVVVEVVDFVAFGKEVGNGGGWGFVRDGAGDDVGDVAVVVLGGNVEFRVAIEAAQGAEVDVATEDGDADGVGFRQVLHAEDELFALLFVLVGGVVVVEVVEEVDSAVELIEETSCNAETFVQEADRADDGRLQDILQPL